MTPPTPAGPRSRPNLVLDELIARTSSIAAHLITADGRTIAWAGATTEAEASSMAALLAAVHLATKELALAIGETRFGVLLQQGESRSMHICLLDSFTFLVVIFEDHRRIGRIRYEARKHHGSLLSSIGRTAVPNQGIQELTTAIERVFGST